MADETALTAQATGIGLVLGAGLASTVGVLVDGSLATLAGYGAGAGLVVGVVAGRVAGANRRTEQLRLRIVGGSAVLGLLVWAAIGLVVAWSMDASLPVGLAVGAATGVVHGGLVGGLVLTRVDRRP